jgi:hypothetical protein
MWPTRAWMLTSMASDMDDDVATVVHLERRLLESSVRGSAASLEALLDPEFREVGASGHVWTRDSIIQALTQSGGAAAPIRDEDMDGRRLADHLVLLTYLSDAAGRRARRTSLWRRDPDAGWRLLHHQGTPVP